MNLNTTFLLSGGAGKLLCAIPALEKFHRLNPNDNFKVLVPGWEEIFLSHPLLQPRIINTNSISIFETSIKQNKIKQPEPYLVYGYYNQQLSIIEAFDEVINNTNDHSDLAKPNLYLSSLEQLSAKRVITELKEQYNKSKVIIVQPFGSGTYNYFNFLWDTSNRSLTSETYLQILQLLPKNCLVIFFGSLEIKPKEDTISVDLSKFNPDLRMYMSLISECDYFIGCDSVGQHIAYSFQKPGSIFLGATSEKNVTYPNHFRIIRKANQKPIYSPMGISLPESSLTDRLNDGIMNFSREETVEFCSVISKDLASLSK